MPLTHTYSGRGIYNASVEEVLKLFETFAVTHLQYDWRKVDSGTADDGSAYALFSASWRMGVRLKPISIAGRLIARHRAYRYGDYCVRDLDYDYRLRFDFTPQDGVTAVAYDMIEQIDRHHRCRDFAIGRDFAAPSMPDGRGDIGVKFLAFVEECGFRNSLSSSLSRMGGKDAPSRESGAVQSVKRFWRGLQQTWKEFKSLPLAVRWPTYTGAILLPIVVSMKGTYEKPGELIIIAPLVGGFLGFACGVWLYIIQKGIEFLKKVSAR
jgi:hypothetical protein